MNVLLQKRGNKTHYQVKFNHCNGKSFFKLQIFSETVLPNTF